MPNGGVGVGVEHGGLAGELAVMDELEGPVGAAPRVRGATRRSGRRGGRRPRRDVRVIGKDEGLVTGSWVALTMWQSTWDFAISCQSRLPNAP